MRRLAPLALLGLAACVCAQPPDEAAVAPPPSTVHPLLGRIYDVEAQAFIDEAQLTARLLSAPRILLGETHDNPEHHQLQAHVLDTLAAGGKRPAVVLEMLSDDDADELAEYLARPEADAAGLGRAVGWDQSGWPAWSLYQPIAEAALRHQLPLLAGDLGNNVLERLRTLGEAGLTPEETDELALGTPLGAEQRQSMIDELRASHCGFGDDEMFARMLIVQRARDHKLRAALGRAAAQHGSAVLIAGVGHVRSDRVADAGVAVGLLEIDDAALEPALYGRRFDGRLPFAYVWFTRRAERKDPCARFRTRPPA